MNYLDNEFSFYCIITFYKDSGSTEDFILLALKYSCLHELMTIKKCWKGSEFTPL